MSESIPMDRNLALEAVRVTEAAALAASRLMGRGDEKSRRSGSGRCDAHRAEQLGYQGNRRYRRG